MVGEGPVRIRAGIFLIAGLLAASGCLPQTRSRGVYVLLEDSTLPSRQSPADMEFIGPLLLALQPGDTLAVATIAGEHFSAGNLVAGTTFASRPSLANRQKRIFLETVRRNFRKTRGGRRTDLCGGILHAVEYLNHTNVREKIILLVSDLQDTPSDEYGNAGPFQLEGFQVVAVRAGELGGGVTDAESFSARAARWRKIVEDSRGTWSTLPDVDSLGDFLANPDSVIP